MRGVTNFMKPWEWQEEILERELIMMLALIHVENAGKRRSEFVPF
jgi:hypothetical protein